MSVILFTPAAIADTPTFTLSIKNHLFEPAEMELPANTKVKLVVENKDATPEEFESHDLNREKIVAGNSKIIMYLGPLKPGEYAFFGEFHEDTAKGKFVVR